MDCSASTSAQSYLLGLLPVVSRRAKFIGSCSTLRMAELIWVKMLRDTDRERIVEPTEFVLNCFGETVSGGNAQPSKSPLKVVYRYAALHAQVRSSPVLS